jgi:hypothetical protein
LATFDTVRELALALPEVEETTSYGTPSFKLRRKMLARLREEGDVLVVRIDIADKEFLIDSRPDVYFTLPHYDGYAAVLVRLPAIGREELGRLLEAAWHFVAPPRLAAQHPRKAPRESKARSSARELGEDPKKGGRAPGE